MGTRAVSIRRSAEWEGAGPFDWRAYLTERSDQGEAARRASGAGSWWDADAGSLGWSADGGASGTGGRKGRPSKAWRRQSRTGRPCFLTVEMYPRMRQKSAAACALRNVPEIFTFTMRMSRSAWLLRKGTRKSCRKRSAASLRSCSRSTRLRALLCFSRPRRGDGGADGLIG